MPSFRGPVTIYAEITVEGDDMYDADEKARSLSGEQIITLIQEGKSGWARADFEVFPDEFPQEV